jgi:hypothetical protein
MIIFFSVTVMFLLVRPARQVGEIILPTFLFPEMGDLNYER